MYRTDLPVGIKVKVLREGMFIFDFSGWPPGCAIQNDKPDAFDAMAAVILQRVAVINTHLACLYTALSRRQHCALDKMIVTPSELISLKSLDDTGMSFGDLRVCALALARYPSTYTHSETAIFDWRINQRTTLVEVGTIAESFKLLVAILQHPTPHALLVTDLFARSCKAYEDHNYSLCLTVAWAIIEKLLQLLWERYVEQNHEREIDGVKVNFINKTRREKLTESRDFNASVISEILSITNTLPFSLYQEITKVRQTRNNWIHDLEPVSREIAETSVSMATKLLNLADGINLDVPLISRIHE